MMRTPTTPTMPTFWRVAPFAVLVIIAAAAFGSAWERDRRAESRADHATAKAERLTHYCGLIKLTVQNARRFASDRSGVGLWNDLAMYDARALAPCVRDGGDLAVTACKEGDAACVRLNADTALGWFEATDPE